LANVLNRTAAAAVAVQCEREGSTRTAKQLLADDSKYKKTCFFEVLQNVALLARTLKQTMINAR
jgi:hypothetical protein